MIITENQLGKITKIDSLFDKIINGDAISVMGRLPAKSVDLTIADPPYFKTVNEKWDFKWRTEEDYLVWTEKWIKEL